MDDQSAFALPYSTSESKAMDACVAHLSTGPANDADTLAKPDLDIDVEFN
jgi:hypothetical protein